MSKKISYNAQLGCARLTDFQDINKKKKVINLGECSSCGSEMISDPEYDSVGRCHNGECSDYNEPKRL